MKAFTGKYGDLNKGQQPEPDFTGCRFGLSWMLSRRLLNRPGKRWAWTKADIFFGPVFPQREDLHTDDPTEALARSLNDKGIVDLD